MLCHIGKLVQFYYGGSAPQRRDLVRLLPSDLVEGGGSAGVPRGFRPLRRDLVRLLPSDLVGVVWGGEGLVV